MHPGHHDNTSSEVAKGVESELRMQGAHSDTSRIEHQRRVASCFWHTSSSSVDGLDGKALEETGEEIYKSDKEVSSERRSVSSPSGETRAVIRMLENERARAAEIDSALSRTLCKVPTNGQRRES
ncbi:hypothetical protein B0H14DRAFT_3477526 [Mycena olivaceomarginata]|nr:hypothetical protein B0H14DRAFT_3477526 [Mycena olivaceomarginata]